MPQLPTAKFPAGGAPPAAAPSGGTDYAALLASIQKASQPVDTRSILQNAHATALQNTGSIVQGIQAQQQADRTQAAQEAQNITGASDAAAHFLNGLNLGGKLAGSYQQAGRDQAGLAAGFSGQLQRTVGNEAAQVSHGLAALGAPGGSLPSTAGDAGNAVYALGGQIPANAMLANAPGAVAQAQGAVRGLTGYGQQQALGTLGAGQQAAARLQPSIFAAEAKTPTLTSQYATQLLTAAEKSRQDAIGNAYKAVQLEQAGQKQAAEQAYQQSEVDARNYATQVTAAHDAATEQIGQQNANTSSYRATHPTAKIVGTDKTGRYELTPQGVVQLPGALGKPVPASAKTGPGTSSWSTLVRDTNKAVQSGTKSTAPSQHYAPTDKNAVNGFVTVPGTGTPATQYGEALQSAITNGPNTAAWRAKATKIVNAHYAEGENGRPYSPKNAIVTARSAAAAAYQGGLPIDTAVTNIVNNSGGLLPRPVVQAAVLREYYQRHGLSPLNGVPPGR